MKITFDRAAIMRRVQTEMKTACRIAALELQAEIQKKLGMHASNLMNGGMASEPGQPPGLNTGALRRSIQIADTSDGPMNPRYTVGTNLPYAAIQEYGGRIRAKKGKFLPVPVGVEGKRAMRQAKGNLRSLNLTLIRTKQGKLMLVKPIRKGKRGEAMFKILFVLKKEVYLPARPYFRPVYAEKMPSIKRDLAMALDKAIRGKP